MKNLFAIAVIFCGAAIAWMILGGTLLARTDQSDEDQRSQLTAQWGSDQLQTAPRVSARVGTNMYVNVPVRSSRINVNFDLEQRRKGLLWYNLYNVRFAAHYRVRNDTTAAQISVLFPFPSSDGSYADLSYFIGGRRVDLASALTRGGVTIDLPPGRQTTIDVSYLSRGIGTWQYRFGKGIQSVNDFALTMTTNFNAIAFPEGTLLPVEEQQIGAGMRLSWHYSGLVTGNGIGMAFPYPLQPGPLAQRITFWAPVALLFYFFAMVMFTTLRGIDLHPANYFFLACAFFAFHLLFAYLVDRIALEAAFVICSLMSMFLTISYLRLVVGWRFAAVESGLAQLIYLVLFSYALFNEGWSGLAITSGAIITLFLAMQLTGRIRWSDRLSGITEATTA